jgi:hypothetical protein
MTSNPEISTMQTAEAIQRKVQEMLVESIEVKASKYDHEEN